jgi:hypothetical protein
VIRYDSKVTDYDVPDIHREARERIAAILNGIHQGGASQVVILAGDPGMGKSHLINSFRSPKEADALGYVLVGNSNHWEVDQFEARLLNWILEALTRPSPNVPHLLLEKIQDVAFAALHQILSQPGQLRRFERARGFWGQLWRKVRGGDENVQRRVEARDLAVFDGLNFSRFASYVCDRFLHEGGNPFHRYVMRVLLRYLFEDERELVEHWLEGKPVDFSPLPGVKEAMNASYKLIDTIKILISLFTADVARGLGAEGASDRRGKVFFFAFDQMEGRQELFKEDDDWMTFFAQLSELYNTLPNVFILFTMTLSLRQRLYPQMEGQFKDRISRDDAFRLSVLPDNEILALYRKRVDHWLGEPLANVRERLAALNEYYLPFTQEKVLGLCRERTTLRGMMELLDLEFCKFLQRLVTGPRLDYLGFRHALQPMEQNPRPHTEHHLRRVKDLLDQAGSVAAGAFRVTLVRTDWRLTNSGHRVLWMEFRDPDNPGQWVCVFLARLPHQYNQVADGCIELLKNRRINRNFLWMVRPERIDKDLKERRPGQIFIRTLLAPSHSTVEALLQLLENRQKYSPEEQAVVDDLLRGEVQAIYLGEMLEQVREALAAHQGTAPPADAEAELSSEGGAAE